MSVPNPSYTTFESIASMVLVIPGSTGLNASGLAWIGIGQFLLAVSAVYLVYRARERSVMAGVLTGIGLPAMVVVAQYYVGRTVFAVTVDEMIQLVLVSVGFGGVGLVLAATVLEPEIDEPLIPTPSRNPQEVNNG